MSIRTTMIMGIITMTESLEKKEPGDAKEPAIKNLFRLIQFSDSAFPVGTFSFSNGLETAAHMGVVKTAEDLKSFARSAARQAAFSDGVAALKAHRAILQDDYEGLVEADKKLSLFKINEEARLMQSRMGKKMAELGAELHGADSVFGRWLEDIKAGRTPGYYPIAQAMAFAREGLGEKELFAAHQYGVINMILSAALRLLRVSHYDTQRILFELSEEAGQAYEEARRMDFNDMNSFVPEMDILASLHEKGNMRMFMN